MTTEQIGINRIIRLQNAQDAAQWDLRDAKAELATIANIDVWNGIFERRRQFEDALFEALGGYDHVVRCPTFSQPDPFYEQARRNSR